VAAIHFEGCSKLVASIRKHLVRPQTSNSSQFLLVTIEIPTIGFLKVLQ